MDTDYCEMFSVFPKVTEAERTTRHIAFLLLRLEETAGKVGWDIDRMLWNKRLASLKKYQESLSKEVAA